MKNPFKKLAALCVTAYAKKIFNQAITVAENRYKENPDMYYVITDPSDAKRLMCINTKQFLEMRKYFKIPGRSLPINELKQGCWYHTKSKTGKDAIGFRDLSVRKLAFCRELLQRAKLA